MSESLTDVQGFVRTANSLIYQIKVALDPNRGKNFINLIKANELIEKLEVLFQKYGIIELTKEGTVVEKEHMEGTLEHYLHQLYLQLNKDMGKLFKLDAGLKDVRAAYGKISVQYQGRSETFHEEAFKVLARLEKAKTDNPRILG